MVFKVLVIAIVLVGAFNYGCWSHTCGVLNERSAFITKTVGYPPDAKTERLRSQLGCRNAGRLFATELTNYWERAK